jgi:arginase family enzyme
VTVIPVGDVVERGMTAVVDAALTRLAGTCDVIYVDVDIDVLDRSLAPGCPGARPGGLSIRDLAEGVRRCAMHHKVAAMDLVEVDAAADENGLTLDAMAHIFLSAVAGYAERR